MCIYYMLLTLNLAKACTRYTYKPTVLPVVAYPSMRLEQSDGVESRRQCNPLRETREGRTSPLIPWGWELGSNGMVNVSEPLINAVIAEQAKGIDRLEPKGKGARSWGVFYPCANNATPVKRRNLNRSLWIFMQNLVSPYLSRKGKQSARKADGDADRRSPKKQMPTCNGPDSDRMP